ncbi:MAG: 6,7-dimethyl-8-ribityllumazine synthase [Prevotellaceae bacterium]|jgi:6,7-dimethyl-8-ribityllumazine synthase|nr:6,7-dimethyl-8-ribityllumazine synthase [Prevotellaceae bacterium]
MATQYQNLSDYDATQMPDKSKLAEQRYAIVVADWNADITYSLLQSAQQTFIKHGVEPGKIKVVHVPGTFELTYAAKQLLSDCYCIVDNVKVYKYAAVVVLGCVIKGETPHFDYVCQGVTQGITHLNTLEEGCPVVFGVLTTNTLEQAQARAGGKHGNKGVEAAITAIKMGNLIW